MIHYIYIYMYDYISHYIYSFTTRYTHTHTHIYIRTYTHIHKESIFNSVAKVPVFSPKSSLMTGDSAAGPPGFRSTIWTSKASPSSAGRGPGASLSPRGWSGTAICCLARNMWGLTHGKIKHCQCWQSKTGPIIYIYIDRYIPI